MFSLFTFHEAQTLCNFVHFSVLIVMQCLLRVTQLTEYFKLSMSFIEQTFLGDIILKILCSTSCYQLSHTGPCSKPTLLYKEGLKTTVTT